MFPELPRLTIPWARRSREGLVGALGTRAFSLNLGSTQPGAAGKPRICLFSWRRTATTSRHLKYMHTGFYRKRICSRASFTHITRNNKQQRADCRLQEETAAALHSSYDQRDPCGEGEQLQVPRCKHLRGPDLDCTHSNTGQESQAKTVPSATAEEIQGLSSNPENFLFRGHRKCTDSVHLSVVQ